MAAHGEKQKAHEIANEVRRVNKQLKEAQQLAQTYNNRERLFGQPVTNVSNIVTYSSTFTVRAQVNRDFIQ